MGSPDAGGGGPAGGSGAVGTSKRVMVGDDMTKLEVVKKYINYRCVGGVTQHELHKCVRRGHQLHELHVCRRHQLRELLVCVLGAPATGFANGIRVAVSFYH